MSEHEVLSMSLLDLAAFDTSDLKAQVGRLQPAGLYIIELNSIGFAEQPAKDPADPSNYRFESKGQILAFQPLSADSYNGNPEDMVGRDLREGVFLSGKDIQAAIQQLMGKYKLAGFRHKGPMGGVEGSAPGWVDEAKGKRVAVRVRQYTTAGGEDRVAFDWLSPKQLKSAGLEWADTMGRDFLDEKGNPVEIAA